MLLSKIKVLNETLWEGQASNVHVDQWIDNFCGACASAQSERDHALYLLSKFLYFGQLPIRQLLRAMFRDLIWHRLSAQIRLSLPSDSKELIHTEFLHELKRTRFLGLGNPAESGTHILYDFRLINQLPLELFVSTHDLFSGRLDDPNANWELPDVTRVIFIDDFCGTGEQASTAGCKIAPVIRAAAERSSINVSIWYLTLFGTTAGLNEVRRHNVFDCVESVSQLDPTYRVFGDDSQFFHSTPRNVTKDEAERMVHHYGALLSPLHPLGYENSQLMIGFHHNIPDNTLPIFIRNRTHPSWWAIFPRHEKISYQSP